MEIITPGIRNKLQIPRSFASNEEIAEIGKIDIKLFKSTPLASLPLTYHELGELSCIDPTWKMDLLWKIVWPLRSPRPVWTGLMQTVAKGPYPGNSSISYMPMIDMSATDMSCVYSTLHFVCAQAKAQNVTPILTFDQPLWLKAQIIIQNELLTSELQNIVLRLRGFHTEMSYLRCIQELMEVVYASNTVMQMLSGKALSRTVRGHFLINAVLNALLVQKAFSVPQTVAKQDLTSETDTEQIC
ncbi:hypothetical protein SNE40_014400 [Patella caerulea]|uniref:Uncharacterized protein n=1 Tax=Patella caerulea TaxID=87958 RepID=A0AAN8PQE1_PATCE